MPVVVSRYPTDPSEPLRRAQRKFNILRSHAKSRARLTATRERTMERLQMLDALLAREDLLE